MSRILAIDDLRIFEFECIYARTPESGFHHIFDPEGWDEVWLDHDLGYGPNGDILDIRPVVSAVEEFASIGIMLPITQFFVITDNPWGRDWLMAALRPYYPIQVSAVSFRIGPERAKPPNSKPSNS